MIRYESLEIKEYFTKVFENPIDVDIDTNSFSDRYRKKDLPQIKNCVSSFSKSL